MPLNLDNFTNWINGSTGSSAELAEKLTGLGLDLTTWREKLGRIEARSEQAKFDLADEKTLARIEIDRQVALSRIVGLGRRIEETRKLHDEAQRSERAKAQAEKRAALTADLEEWQRNFLQPTVDGAAQLLVRAESLGEPAAVADVAPILSFLVHFISERRPDFAAGLATLSRRREAAPQQQRSVQRAGAATPQPTSRSPLPTIVPAVLRSAVPARRVDQPAWPPTVQPRTVRLYEDEGAGGHYPPLPNDLRPLQGDEVPVVVVQKGYPDPRTGAQCQTGRRFPLDRTLAEAAAKNGAVEILPASNWPPTDSPAASEVPAAGGEQP